jgi:hypothetical protein
MNPVDPAVDLTTLEKYGRVEKAINASGAACYKFGYQENPDYDTFEAFEKTRRDFIVYSSVEGSESGLMLKSLYIDGQWREQEEILMDDFSEETGEFEEIGSAAAKEVKKILELFNSKGIKP